MQVCKLGEYHLCLVLTGHQGQKLPERKILTNLTTQKLRTSTRKKTSNVERYMTAPGHVPLYTGNREKKPGSRHPNREHRSGVGVGNSGRKSTNAPNMQRKTLPTSLVIRDSEH